MENETNLTKKTNLKIGKGILLKILEEDSIMEDTGNGNISTNFKIKKGFYIGKNYFDANEGNEIVCPEFSEEQSSGRKTFDLFAYEDKNYNVNLAYKLSNLEINPKKRLDVKYFPIEFFHSSPEIKYIEEYLKERIKNWENK